MNIAIVYDSSTGTTAVAAEAMGAAFAAHGHQCRVQSVAKADPTEVAKADLICIGAWVKGMLIISQRPSEGSLKFIERLGSVAGRKVVVFCTYKVAAGSTLSQLVKALEKKGAIPVGQFQYRGAKPDGKFTKFAQALH